MKRRIKLLLPIIIILPIVFWLWSFFRCETLTNAHLHEFVEFDKINSATKRKVLEYDDDSAEIYCVYNYNPSFAEIITFKKNKDGWHSPKSDGVVWSEDKFGFVWPYFR